MENERYLFVTSDDNVSKIIDFIWPVYKEIFRSVYKELHADHETGAADNK